MAAIKPTRREVIRDTFHMMKQTTTTDRYLLRVEEFDDGFFAAAWFPDNKDYPVQSGRTAGAAVGALLAWLVDNNVPFEALEVVLH